MPAETWKAGPKSRRVTDANGQLVAMVMPAGSPEATAARAQLIAAAPKLEAELRWLTGLYGESVRGHFDSLQELLADRHLLAWQQARAILTKDSIQHLVTKDTIGGALHEARTEVKRLDVSNECLTSERDAARAEVERLREALEALLNDLPCPERELIDAAAAALSEREVRDA